MKQRFDSSQNPTNDRTERRYEHPEVIRSRVPVYGYAASITKMILENGYGELIKNPQASPIPDVPEAVEPAPAIEIIPDNVVQFGAPVVQQTLSEVDMIRQQVEESYGLPEAA